MEWGGVHTNGGNKILLVQTAGIELARALPGGGRGRVELEPGHQQHARRPGAVHAARRALLAARAGRALHGATLPLLGLCRRTDGRRTERRTDAGVPEWRTRRQQREKRGRAKNTNREINTERQTDRKTEETEETEERRQSTEDKMIIRAVVRPRA